MGENGAGKSTSMKILSGVYPSYEGDIAIDGRPVSFASVREAEAEGIAIIHQELNLVPELTVADNIFLGREPRIAGLIVDRKRIARDDARPADQLGIALDPGRTRRRACASASSSSSRSPRRCRSRRASSSWTSRHRRFRPPNARGSSRSCAACAAKASAIIYISHRIDEVMHLADRVTVFRDGRHVLTRTDRRTGRGPDHRRDGRAQPACPFRSAGRARAARSCCRYRT